MLGDLDKSQTYLDWYSSEFTDDAGEPIQKICWALMLHRMGKDSDAKYLFGEAMLSNLYLIPTILGENVQKYDMWHSSNFAEIDYVEDFPFEIRRKITEDEVQWMRGLYGSFEFRRIKKRFIEIFHALEHVDSFEERGKLIDKSNSLLNILSS